MNKDDAILKAINTARYGVMIGGVHYSVPNFNRALWDAGFVVMPRESGDTPVDSAPRETLGT